MYTKNQELFGRKRDSGINVFLSILTPAHKDQVQAGLTWGQAMVSGTAAL